MGWKCRSWPTHFSAHTLLSVNILSNVTAADLVFCMTHSSWRSLLNGCMFWYSRTMLSDKQSEHSFSPSTFRLVFVTKKFVLHSWACKNYFILIWELLLSIMPFKFARFRYDCIIANFPKDFCWISRIGSRRWANFKFLTSHLITCHYDTIICVKQLRCIIIKIPNNCRQLVVLCPGVIQLKRHKEEKYIFDEEGVQVFILKNCWNKFLVRNLLPLNLPNGW